MFWKKIMKEKYKSKLFCIELVPRYQLYEAKKVLFNFVMIFSQWKNELEPLELLPPDPLGPKDTPHQRRARPEVAGALFRYINSLENLQSFLNLAAV